MANRAANYYTYWNLHKKCWSVKYKGRVIAHLSWAFIVGPWFQVSEAGRQRVLAEGRKNVHAYVVSHHMPMNDGPWSAPADVGLVSLLNRTKGQGARVTYNPYRGPQFTRRDAWGDHRPVDYADALVLTWRDEHPLVLALAPAARV